MYSYQAIGSVIAAICFASLLAAKEPVPQSKPELKAYLPPEASHFSDGREIKARVLVAYTINTDGSVSEVQVINAEPPGPWESQALDRVQNLTFSGVIVPGYQEVVVTFFQD